MDAALAGLRRALRADPDGSDVMLVPLADKGLAHLHIQLCGTGLLARVPKQSQLGLSPEANLRHQQACFERARPSGHTPRLHRVLGASRELPRGALLVEEITGWPASLPADLPAIARALAGLHALPLPTPQARSPLADPADPLQELVAEVLRQATHLAAAALDEATHGRIEGELRQLQQLLLSTDRPSRHLIAFDAHPGNFLLGAPGHAVLVDLEKCRYGYPGLDLAHATLYTSTTWDVASSAVLSLEEVAGFYAEWEQAVGPGLAIAARPWHVPLRHAMWLWSLTWCCKWRALADRPPRAVAEGEDWSAAGSDPALVDHVRERVDHYLSPGAIGHVQEELAQLRRILAA